jgi:6-phosphofructokinase 1
MEESRTTNRWCLVVVMGRKAGHLALAIGKAAGAIVTVIPEDFSPDEISLGDLCLVLEGAIFKRRAAGRQDGIAVVAEGVAAKMDPAELARVSGVEVGYDAHGNIRLEKIPLAAIIERDLVRRFAERGEAFPLVSGTLGYELRCAAPIPFDIDYTRTLGYGAVRFLFGESGVGDGPVGGMVCLEEGRLRVVPFEDLPHTDSGRIRTRMVDTKSEHYQVAREYMIRLNRRDLDDAATTERIARAARMEPAAFVARFRPAVEIDAAELSTVRG